ncbi:carbohydrate porin [Azospira restricta]|uniref:Carbohydrate porin n=1 Tax=Azospira restricta TaxID=404405 RepID=A0A974PXA4_9RHOO|nr:carbohydrate porin [Azospira restricta]QRJ63167.1 carbohydrate porin [Azospira restricta]
MRTRVLVAALAAAGLCSPALAAKAAPAKGTKAEPVKVATADAALLEKLAARLEKLEARNAELEKEVKTLKSDNEKIVSGLDSDRISQYEPELTARLKAVEKDTLEMKKSAKVIEALDGVKAGASLTMVAQKPAGLPAGTRDNNGRLSYRADVEVELPLAPIGDIEQKLFGHFRLGQGFGANEPLGNIGAFSPANGTAFRIGGVDDDNSSALLAQAWYQASIPLPYGGFKPHSREKLELTFGKIDLFGFFDQNEVAGDEATQFLNTMLVHNPLLDAGGEVAPDGNGFQPGFIAAYVNETNKAEPWRVSLGYFGAGERGASFGRSFNSPLTIAQAEKQLKLFGGLTGNYRAYVWHRSRATELDGVTEKNHTGFGLSADQRIGDGVNVFARFGKLAKGELAFDRALALGAEISGNYWGRGGDALGFGGAWMKASDDFRRAGGTVDLTGDGVTAVSAYAPSGAEKLAEIYYRYRVSPQFHLTPDFQWIGRPGANPDAKAVKVVGVRANVAF